MSRMKTSLLFSESALSATSRTTMLWSPLICSRRGCDFRAPTAAFQGAAQGAGLVYIRAQGRVL